MSFFTRFKLPLLLTGSLLIVSCVTLDPPEDLGYVTAVVRPSADSRLLLRPRGVAVDPLSQTIVVVEEGRRTMTWIQRTGAVVQRRPLRPDFVGAGVVGEPTLEAGTSIVRARDGFWTLLDGLGPVFVPDSTSAPMTLLGAGQGGLAAQQNRDIATVDLSAARGLTLDRDGWLIVAIKNCIIRVTDGQVDIVAGTGVADTSNAIVDASDLNLGFGNTVGLTVDTNGSIYVTDSIAGKIWQISPRGEARLVAGGGSRFIYPREPFPAQDLILELTRSHLVWDDVGDRLILLANDIVYQVLLGEAATTSGDSLADSTIQVIASVSPQSVGLTQYGSEFLVSSLWGTVSSVSDSGSDQLWDPPQVTDIQLAYGAAIDNLGQTGYLIQDPTFRRLALYVEGYGTFRLFEEFALTREPAAPVAGGVDGNAYFVDAGGLRGLDLSTGVQLIAHRQPDRVVPGQLIDEILLPSQGEMRASADSSLWLLDTSYGVLLSVDTQTGSVAHVAGSLRGGGSPRGEYGVNPTQFRMSSPHAITVSNDLLALASYEDAGVGVFAVNTGSDSVWLAGVEVPPATAMHVGGTGNEAPLAGRGFQDIALNDVLRMAILGESLLVSTDDLFAPPLMLIGDDGLVTDISNVTTAPTAIGVLDAETVLLGWATHPQVMALNLAESVTVVYGVEIQPGEVEVVSTFAGGVLDLDVRADGALFVLHSDGMLSQSLSEETTYGQVNDGSTTMALTPSGGLFVLTAGEIWAVDTQQDNQFMGVDLPHPEGAIVVSVSTETLSDSPLGTRPFGDNISTLEVGPDGALYWVDHVDQALFRAPRGEQPQVSSMSSVELLSRGEPIPNSARPLILTVASEQEIYMAERHRIWRFDGDSWSDFAGMGALFPREGAAGTDTLLSTITGMAMHAQGLIVRSSAGLIRFNEDGQVSGFTTISPSDGVDGPALYFNQTLGVVDGDLVVVQAGGVYRVLGWP